MWPKLRRWSSGVAWLLLGLSAVVWGGTRVEPEVYTPVTVNQQQKAQHDLAALAALRVRLGPLPEAHAQLPQGGKRVAAGIGRSLGPAHPPQAIQLPWQVDADGAQRAAVVVSSAGAGAVRLELRLMALPRQAELGFYDPSSGELRQRLSAHQALASNTGSIWSPIMPGESVGVVLFLPAGVEQERVVLEFGHLSHFPEALPGRKFLNDIGNSGACNVDVACSAATPQSIINGVAKYALTASDGFTYICTGTLINDTDASTQQPYFLTAQHCVSTPAEAASMEFFWFFQRDSCGGPVSSRWVRQSGGATLLMEDFDTDHSLLLLNTAPPAGVNLSGWDSAALPQNTPVIGLHHPSGDLKKIATGVAEGAAPYLGRVDGAGDFLRTRWSQGTTEGGSSGSGIFHSEGGGPYLVGVLTGGFASCSAQNSPDWYGRFDRAFPLMEQYLVVEDSGSLPLEGLWWDPTRSGQGMQLLSEDGRLAGVWYLYDQTGQGQWLTFVGEQPDGQGVTLELLRFSGPPSGSPWNASQVISNVAGSLTLTVLDAIQVQADYTLDGVSGRLNLVPFRSGGGDAPSGVWYNPGQSGRGLQLLAQDGLLEGVWYLYDRQGEGSWVTFQTPLGEGSMDAPLLRFSGPPPGDDYDPSHVSFNPVGSATITSIDADRLQFSYQLDGVSESVNLQPFSLSK